MSASTSDKNWTTSPLVLLLLLIAQVAYSQSGQPDYEQLSGLENLIHLKSKAIKESCKITTKFQNSDFIDLPVGIAPQGCGSGAAIIVIDSAYRAINGGTFLSAYASVILPGTTKPLAFAAHNIGFGKGGLTTSSQIKLMLLTPQVIPINENISLEIPADGHNYIEFNCDGFKAINLKGNFTFSNDLLEPDVEPGTPPANVKVSFEINTNDLNNIMATVAITPFKINGLDDVSFEVKDAVVDYSDIINPPGLIFPSGYQQTYGQDIKLWRGFFLKNIIIKVRGLSDSTTSSGKPVIIAAQNMILDDTGVSGVFSAANILSLHDGSAGGWPFSIDKLSVKFVSNEITGGGLEGFLGIPFLGEDSVAYSAVVQQEKKNLNYLFSIALTDSVEFNTPFSAKIKISKGSKFALEKKGNGNILPSAQLHGTLTSTGMVKMKDIHFENLVLIAQAPYVVSGTFSSVGKMPSSGAGFPIQIKDLDLKIHQGQVVLGVAVTLNFMNAEDKGFSGSTRFDIVAKVHEKKETILNGDSPAYTKTREKWAFDKVKVGTISIDCKTQAFALKGSLSLFDDDPVYGTGFHGSIAFRINKVLEKGVKVNAYFGSKETFRYWHVDAYAPTAAIPIPPAMAITGFLGGMSYKMVRQQPLIPDFSKLSENKAEQILDEEPKYVPDNNVGLAFLAGVTLIAGNERAINADVMLEIAFNQGGGVKYIHFDGAAFFLTPIKSRGRMKNGKAPASSVYATMNMLYDHDNDIFHSNMKTYINIAGVLTGTGANGLVGEAVIHMDKQDWYAYIGRPSSLFGVNILGIATAKTYFMIGTKIENLPLPPAEVKEIFNNIDMSLMRDDLAAAGGKGFAAGIHFNLGFDTKNKIRPFYVVAQVGAGTDVMLRHYNNVQCVGMDNVLGINGWYASGQAYVFLIGKVGVKVKGRSFDIVSLGLAAVLQAKLPNPTWMKGMLAGKYKILGGLIKGNFNLKFTIGEACELLNEGGEIDDIKVIADVKPDLDASDVSVFSAPQVSFNTAVGKDFSMMDLQDNLNAYRIVLDEFSISNDGVPIPGTIQWSSSNEVAVLKTADILPPQSTLTIVVRIHWEKKGSSGLWEVVTDNTNAVIYETKESTFLTGTAPDFIPDENVAYSYPVKYQSNLHIGESGAGYIKLNYPQEYLFKTNDGNTSWEYVARFKDSSGKANEVPLTFSATESLLSFDFPAFDKQMLYTLTFLKRAVTDGPIDTNVQYNVVQLSTNAGSDVTTNANNLQGTIAQSVDKEIYKSAFRTSHYNTFGEKWTALGNGNDAFDVAKGNVAVIGKHLNSLEAFDEFELKGKNGLSPLVQLTASTQTPWLGNIISPLLYDLYPYDQTIKIGWRDPTKLGVKPLKGVNLTNSIGDYTLTDADLTAGKAPVTSGSVLVGYYISFYTFWDYNDLSNQASQVYYDNWNGRPEGVKRLMDAKGYTDLLEGNYLIDVNYFLPGGAKPHYSTQVSIKF